MYLTNKSPVSSATLWSALDVALGQALRFTITVVLARLLSPEEFGTVALLALFISIAGLFVEYTEAAFIEQRAAEAGVAGVAYMASRPSNTLYRHNVSYGPGNARPMLIMERDAANRALRLLKSGHELQLTVWLDIENGRPYESYNVIGEIRGATKPDEFVVIGAHLDSWGLGTGALDNGANVALVIDIARQIVRLGLQPDRTIRFALWNGEEQGLIGSWRYTQQHAAEMDGHVMASSYASNIFQASPIRLCVGISETVRFSPHSMED